MALSYGATMGFQHVADLDDLADREALAVEVEGEPIAIVRVGDEVHAVHNICSHEFYELAPEGWVEEACIECALHGSRFDLATGDPSGLPATEPIPVYACEVRDGGVYVDFGQQVNDAPLPW